MKFVNNRIKTKLSDLKKIKKDFDKRRKKSSKFSEKKNLNYKSNKYI